MVDGASSVPSTGTRPPGGRAEPVTEEGADDGAAPAGARRWVGPVVAVGLAAAALGGLALAGRRAAAADPLRRAWAAAAAAGPYAFTGTTRADTVGGVTAYRVSGTGDAAGALTLTVRPGGRASPTATWHVAWPAVAVLDSLTAPGATAAPPDAHAVALLLPAGDPLALVAAGHAASSIEDARVAGRTCHGVSFRVDGIAYAAWRGDHPRRVPANADSGGLDKLSGAGRLWYDPLTHLPCRVSARVALPRLAGDDPGAGEVDWTYGAWRSAATPGAEGR